MVQYEWKPASDNQRQRPVQYINITGVCIHGNYIHEVCTFSGHNAIVFYEPPQYCSKPHTMRNSVRDSLWSTPILVLALYVGILGSTYQLVDKPYTAALLTTQ